MAAPRLDEFARIARFFAPLAAPGALGLLDDVALIDGPPGEQYVLKTDAIVEGVHFLPDDPPAQVAQKLLRVNLSDLAAKGATPVGYLLTTALPTARDEAWLEEFADGLAADQATYGIGLLGGDSVATPGPVTLSVAAIGRVAAGRAVLRSGARRRRSRLCVRHARRRGARRDGGQRRRSRHRAGRSGISSSTGFACRSRGWHSARASSDWPRR